MKPAVLVFVAALSAFAQGPGRGIPGATEQQTAAVARMNTDLAPQVQSLNEARAAMIAIAFAEPRDNQAIATKAEAVRAAELSLAMARADAFAKLQSSSAKLAPN